MKKICALSLMGCTSIMVGKGIGRSIGQFKRKIYFESNYQHQQMKSCLLFNLSEWMSSNMHV
jgi:hypothetical protein